MYGHCPGGKIDLTEDLTTAERREHLATALGASCEEADGILTLIDELERANGFDGDTGTTSG